MYTTDGLKWRKKKRLMNETKRNCVYEDIAPFYMQLSVEFWKFEERQFNIEAQIMAFTVIIDVCKF